MKKKKLFWGLDDKKKKIAPKKRKEIETSLARKL
jgi:hypothetical protein